MNGGKNKMKENAMVENTSDFRDTNDSEPISDIILGYYDMASKVSMIVEGIPEEMDSTVLKSLSPLYDKVKEKDKDLARFLMGMLYSFRSVDATGAILTVMAYLGIESVPKVEG